MTVLLLHHRYRLTGGEERAVRDLQWLIESELGVAAHVLERDSGEISGVQAARGLLTGGIDADEVTQAIADTGATVVHAHNLNPTFGYKAVQAAKRTGARVVLHLHNYRLVCAQAVCFTQGADCTRCHGVNTLPGLRRNCRGGSQVEAVAYAAGLALQQRRIAQYVDAFLVPSHFALQRLRDLGAPIGERGHVVSSVQQQFAEHSRADRGSFALFAGRLTPEKGVEDAIAATTKAGVPLKVAGDGPQLEALRVTHPDVDFLGLIAPDRLAELRTQAALAIVPSRYAEILPLAALEAMAAGLPTVATRAGGLSDAVPDEGLAPIGDAGALSERITALYANRAAGDRALARARALSAPAVIADALRRVYGFA